MLRTRHLQAMKARQGVVLLVVVTLLTLFAVVGITFVIYAQAEAGSMRNARESETLQRPDADPEALLAYFLNQLIYDTNNNVSAMRGHSLARTMYGPAGGTSAFSGTGRIHTNANPAQDDYYNVDYTNYGNAGDPRNPDQYGSPNVGYTYPDFNNMFLAAVRPSDGAILIPSYWRNNPQAGQPGISLRPSMAYHTQFAPPEDGKYDVKNRPDSPGVLLNPGAAAPQYSVNDSVWVDAGFPVIRMPDGRKVKPLFAALVEDLDNRCNVNVHGNMFGTRFGDGNRTSWSNQGYSPGEVAMDRIISAQNKKEAYNLLFGANGVAGRYDKNLWNQGDGYRLNDLAGPSGPFWAQTDLDCNPNNGLTMTMPAAGSGRWAPNFDGAWSNGWRWSAGNDRGTNPVLYNFFSPGQNCYHNGGIVQPQDRRFHVSNVEALLRYSDRGSPALTSELFLLCPQSFSDPTAIAGGGTVGGKTRRLVTTHSFDLARAGVMPMNWAPGQGDTYTLAGPGTTPSRQPVPFPAVGASPGNGEFGPGWKDPLGDLGRLDLNTFHDNYPIVDANAHRMIQPTAKSDFWTAMKQRQLMAQQLFDVLRKTTGAAPQDPITANPVLNTPGTPEYNALRWLAQLAVNIVDFRQTIKPQWGNGAPDQCPLDIMTAFNWNPNFTNDPDPKKGWVFGTVMPRLVLNEVYTEVDTRDTDANAAMATKFDVNVWVELYNGFINQNGQGGGVNSHTSLGFTEDAAARLWVAPNGQDPGYGAYRIIIAQTVDPNDNTKDNKTAMRAVDNVLGTPSPTTVQAVVDKYDPSPTTNPNTMMPQTTVLNGDSLNTVLAVSTNGGPPWNKGPQGGNQGYFVIGPGGNTPSPKNAVFPGTGANPNCFPTLPLKEQPCASTDYNGQNSSMHYVYSPPNPAQFTGQITLNHTVVLQRLVNPYLPPQTDPTQIGALGYYNPYVTVDYVDRIPINDGLTVDGVNKNHQATPLAQRASYGRNQPYAAEFNQQIQQQSQPANPAMPNNTFFFWNNQNAAGAQNAWAYDWLYLANRPLTSPMELLMVSAYKPSELTQQFMTGAVNAQGKAAQRFQHMAPWIDPNVGIYRLMEFVEGSLRPQWSPVGGRFYGRININTLWDPPSDGAMFKALCDRMGDGYFTDTAVANIYQRMYKSRTVNNSSPGPGDRPFLGMAAPNSPAGLQFPNGVSVEDTFLRSNPADAGLPQNQRRFLFEAIQDAGCTELLGPGGGQPSYDNPFLRYQLMHKIFGNTTTRSNVFALWLTVGFFEVVDDSNANLPPKLGKEIGKAEGRQVRHRMFAILDRTNLTIDPNTATLQGPRPWFIDSLSNIKGDGSQEQVQVYTTSGNYEELTGWKINVGDKIWVDVGTNPNQAPNKMPQQEQVTVTAVTATSFTASFTVPHPYGCSISNVQKLGNPGPQQYFDPRQPQYQGIVRWFSIIE